MVWIAPLVGAFWGLLTTVAIRRGLAQAGAPAPAPAQEPAPEEVRGTGVEPFPLRPHLHVAQGFAMVDWGAAAGWLATITGADARNLARVDLHRAWLGHLRESQGDRMWLHESDEAMILSPLEPAVAAATSRYVSMARKRVARTLGTLAHFPAGLKSVVLVMDDLDAYYAYISLFRPGDGEQAFSGGCFIGTGCPHFVVPRTDLAGLEPVIAHELTHSALAHLGLPLWIDEGLAVNTEHRIAGAGRGLHTPRQLHEKHVAFWNDETIQQFWAGTSFRRPDDGNLLSYDLARIMVAQMGRAWPAFERFAREAERADAGAASARKHLQLDLGGYVRLLCEHEPDGAWQPAFAAAPAGGAPGARADAER
ncbi:MAG TPA: hypothetical protein VF457_09630 [Burkholderiaceae bacterium]